MSRVLVLGAGGMLGHKVCQRLRGHEVIGTVRKADVSEYQAFREVFDGVTLLGGVDVLESGRLEATIRDLSADFVVNGIGLVKQLEQAADPYLAMAINARLPHRLARLCSEIGARLIHISTDCVFDGARGSYRESDVTDAADLYGRSKALGETGPHESAAVTLRASFIGRELTPPKHGLLEWFLDQDGGVVDGFARAMYSGLTSIELADVIRRIIDRASDLRGLYHVASDAISKYDLLQLIRRTYSLDIGIRKAAEPVCDRSLVMIAFSRTTGYVAPSWTEMISQMYQDPTPYDAWMTKRESKA